MIYFIRKVDTSQWGDILPESQEILEMHVDGITNCCKTYDNALSIWKTSNKDINSSENQKILTGMAMSRDRPAAFSIIFLSQEELDRLGLQLKSSLGDTPYEEIANFHYDIIDLNLKKMGDLAWVIHEKVNNDDEIKVVAEQEIVEFTKRIFAKAEDLPLEKKSQKKWKGIYS